MPDSLVSMLGSGTSWVAANGARIKDQPFPKQLRAFADGAGLTAIGEVAEKNLASLGHVTLVFDGGSEPRMPGAIHLGGLDEKPALTLGASLIFACA